MRTGLVRFGRSTSAGTRGRRAAAALTVASALMVPFATATVAAAAPVAHTAPVSHTGPAYTQTSGATVTSVDWLSDRRVALWIDSPSMGTPIQVQLLLARDWNINPQATFPQV